MRKLAVLLIVLLFGANSCYAWWWKKDDAKSTSGTPVEIQEPSKGYVGTLPDISKDKKSSEPNQAKPIIDKNKNFNSSNEIKPIPRDNPSFINIILKPEKISPYINDINELLPQLENILSCIENKDNVQKFNAKVYFLNKNIEYLEDKYAEKPESKFISFQRLLELNTHSKSVANLRSEAEKYRPYLAYTGAGYLYQDNIIEQQLEYLKSEIEDVIVVIKEAK